MVMPLPPLNPGNRAEKAIRAARAEKVWEFLLALRVAVDDGYISLKLVEYPDSPVAPYRLVATDNRRGRTITIRFGGA